MNHSHVPRRAAIAGIIAGLMVAAALPVHAVNIPEGGAVTPDSSFLFHLRVTSGCEGLPTDTLEVTIPEGVTNPVPEAVPGWDVEIEAPEVDEEDTAESEREDETEKPDGEALLTQVRWSGGSLDDGYLLDFGIRARFPDEEGEVLEFPVIQRCGEVEVEHAPTVTLTKRYGQSDIADLGQTVDRIDADVQQLRADVDQLQQQVGGVDVVNLRSRVSDTETAIEDLDERVGALEGEPTPEPEPEPEPAE
jgi:uncharacterized protein YcnI